MSFRWSRDWNIQYLPHKSNVLAGNPLGDPVDREVLVWLPPDYQSQASKHYPVIWVLPPFGGWGQKLLNVNAWDDNIIQRTQRLTTTGKMEPVILAMPDCLTRYGGSQYVNSSATGQYEDYIIKELVPFIDDNFRTLPSSEHRAVLGYSSGGYGALVLTMHNPELFGAVACHSGDMFFESSYRVDFPRAVSALEEFGGLKQFLSDFETTSNRGSSWHIALNIIAMSACYSPNIENPVGFDIPFDNYTGELLPEVWNRWLQKDPVKIAQQQMDALQALKAIYVDCGNRDEFNLFLGARLLHRILDKHNVAHVYEEFDGGHRDINWRFDHSLPLISHALHN